MPRENEPGPSLSYPEIPVIHYSFHLLQLAYTPEKIQRGREF